MQALSRENKLKLGVAVINRVEKLSEILDFNKSMKEVELDLFKRELSLNYLNWMLIALATGRVKNVEDAMGNSSFCEFLRNGASDYGRTIPWD
jgi:hypothetical protein